LTSEEPIHWLKGLTFQRQNKPRIFAALFTRESKQAKITLRLGPDLPEGKYCFNISVITEIT
jgi:hypothetical protein